MRFAALLHDAAKPQTRRELPGGRVTFVGHDSEGAGLARDVLRRLRASERLARLRRRAHPPPPRPRLPRPRAAARRGATIWRYLAATEPYSADVTLLTVADRLATRGRKAEPAIAAHLELAREVLEHAFALREAGPQAPLVPGDELAAELGIRPGPRLGELLRALEEDRYAGEIGTREEAVARARELLRRPARRRRASRGAR